MRHNLVYAQHTIEAKTWGPYGSTLHGHVPVHISIRTFVCIRIPKPIPPFTSTNLPCPSPTYRHTPPTSPPPPLAPSPLPFPRPSNLNVKLNLNPNLNFTRYQPCNINPEDPSAPFVCAGARTPFSVPTTDLKVCEQCERTHNHAGWYPLSQMAKSLPLPLPAACRVRAEQTCGAAANATRGVCEECTVLNSVECSLAFAKDLRC
jgi:hypothetical protein